MLIFRAWATCDLITDFDFDFAETLRDKMLKTRDKKALYHHQKTPL